MAELERAARVHARMLANQPDLIPPQGGPVHPLEDLPAAARWVDVEGQGELRLQGVLRRARHVLRRRLLRLQAGASAARRRAAPCEATPPPPHRSGGAPGQVRLQGLQGQRRRRRRALQRHARRRGVARRQARHRPPRVPQGQRVLGRLDARPAAFGRRRGRSRHRRPPRSPVAGTAAKVKLGITCTVCAVRGRVPPAIPRRRFRAAALKTKPLFPRRRTTTTSRRAAWTPRARRARASSAYASSGRGGAACELSAGFSAGQT